MEIFSKDNNLEPNYSEFFISEPPIKVVDIFELLANVFFLNKEDRFRAGIFIGKEGREWIEKSALIIPPAKEE